MSNPTYSSLSAVETTVITAANSNSGYTNLQAQVDAALSNFNGTSVQVPLNPTSGWQQWYRLLANQYRAQGWKVVFQLLTTNASNGQMPYLIFSDPNADVSLA